MCILKLWSDQSSVSHDFSFSCEVSFHIVVVRHIWNDTHRYFLPSRGNLLSHLLCVCSNKYTYL